jgi:DNA ligase-1
MECLLFKETKLSNTINILTWEARVEGNIIKKRHYYQSRISKPEFTEKAIFGKNFGKINSTSNEEQAEIVFLREKQKKIDDGYYEVGIKNVIEIQQPQQVTFIKPMLVTPKMITDVINGTFVVQPKLDGIRCIMYIRDNGEVVCQSRQGKYFKFLDNIQLELMYLPNRIYDGELYNPTMKFQEIIANININMISPGPNISKIEFHVFDIIDYKLTQLERTKVIQEIDFSVCTHIKKVDSMLMTDIKDIEEYYIKCISGSYEGIILRSVSSLYVNKRSRECFKIKAQDSTECTIVGFTEAEGVEKGMVIWKCSHNNKEFRCRPNGSHEYRKLLFQNAKDYIGKPYTVKHQGFSQDGIPRFPVGITIREYE